MKKIKVIEVVSHGECGYLVGSSMWDKLAFDAAAAKNYLGKDAELEKDIAALHIKGDQFYGISAARMVDQANVVELEIELKEVSRRPARELYK